jgi:hypothetical protein
MELEHIKNSILEIRGKKVMLDMDLAKVYEVETRVLKQAVRRNIDRFPSDFMFQLTEIEMHHLVSQNVIPTLNHFGGAKPFAFTEQGVAMLSSVLKSKKAIHMNISIMRAFVMMRQCAPPCWCKVAMSSSTSTNKNSKKKTSRKFLTGLERVLQALAWE